MNLQVEIYFSLTFLLLFLLLLLFRLLLNFAGYLVKTRSLLKHIIRIKPLHANRQ